ncbi:MAG: DNA-binding protein [Candidatus Heimdallarchaeota archaeon]|nr:MAG: DNA-binding protein [Candidatus Heimdallarchaeota archaeon]
MTQSQTQLIRQHLEEGHAITSMMALNMFNCFRLAARISDLRQQGLDIITRKITRNGKCFASYELKETE